MTETQHLIHSVNEAKSLLRDSLNHNICPSVKLGIMKAIINLRLAEGELRMYLLTNERNKVQLEQQATHL